MAKRRYTKEEKENILQEVKLTKNRRAVAAKYSISESTIRGWDKKPIEPLEESQKGLNKKNKALEVENRALKDIAAEKDLEIKILKDMLKKM